MRTQRAFIWLIAASLALVAAGCTGPTSTDGDSTLTVAFYEEPMQSLFSTESSMFLVFLPLVARNADGELEGRLAERWEHSPDYRTWTVHLRQGVRWHDGVPVTTHDVKFTLDLLTTDRLLYAQPGGFTVTELLSGNVDAVNFVAPETVLILSKDDRFRAYHSSNSRHNRSSKTSSSCGCRSFHILWLMCSNTAQIN